MDNLKEKRIQMIKGLQDSLRMIRQVIDLSSQELGDYIGLTRQTICKIETNKTSLNAAQYLALCALLDREIAKNEGSLDQIKAILKAKSESKTDVIQLKNDSFLEGWFETYEELHVDMELIKSKILNDSDLANLCGNYKIFFTHDIFELDSIEQFIFKLIPYLTDANATILMPVIACDIIENRRLSADEEVASKANRAFNILVSLDKSRLLDMRRGSEDRDLEEELMDVFNKHKEKYSIALFTKNESLAEKVLSLNDEKTDETLPIIVCSVNEEGDAERITPDDRVIDELQELLKKDSVRRFLKREDVEIDEVDDGCEEDLLEDVEIDESKAPDRFITFDKVTGWDL